MRYVMKQKMFALGDDVLVLATAVVIDMSCHADDRDR
jgi:hypothetical protein